MYYFLAQHSLIFLTYVHLNLYLRTMMLIVSSMLLTLEMVDDSDEELYKMGIALKTSAEKEESNLEELSKLKQLLVGKNDSDGRDENRNTEMQQEIAGLKDDLAKLRQQIVKKDEEIKELESELD